MRSELHASGAGQPGKGPQYRLYERLCGLTTQSGCCGEEKHFREISMSLITITLYCIF
jgi:hypothetical protein